MHKTELHTYIDGLVEKGTLAPVLVKAMLSEEYDIIAELLQAYNENIGRLNFLDRAPEKEANARQQAYDILQDVVKKLPERQHAVFYALVFRSIPYKIERESEALAHHSFMANMRNAILCVSRETALETVKNLWDAQDKRGFLYVIDVLTAMQNAEQRKTDPDLCEPTFIDDIASYPGLEFIIINVKNGNAIYPSGYGAGARLPTLRVLVSNVAKPTEDDDGNTKGTLMDADDFWILTARETFTDLKSYMRASLRNREESVGYGPYRFSSNDDRTYGTAANVIAGIHEFLRVPRNFEASAQDRLRTQIQSIETTALAPVYMNRFLRTQKYQGWVAALNLAKVNVKEQPMIEELIGYEDAAATLVKYGFIRALNDLDHGPIHDDIETARAAYMGYVSGMHRLHEDMHELSNITDKVSGGDALDRFERERGFHADALYFPVSDRKRLAYQDLSDIVIGHLTSSIMLNVLLGEREAKSVSPIWTLRDEILQKIPVSGIMDTMIKAGDVTNFMRLADHLDDLSITLGGKKTPPRYAGILNNKIEKAGYVVSDRHLRLKRFGGLPFRAVYDGEGTLFIRSGSMARYKTVEKIINEDHLPAAVLARHILDISRNMDHARAHILTQTEQLDDFIEKKRFAKDIETQLSDVPAEQRPFHLAFIREAFPSALDRIAEAENLSPEELAREKRVVAEAFDQVAAQGRRKYPSFSRVIQAISNTAAGIINRKPS